MPKDTVVIWAQNSSNRWYKHTRPRSPNQAEVRRQQFVEHVKPTDFEQIEPLVQKAPTYSNSGSFTPADSELTWTSPGENPLGLQSNAVPEDVTFESARVGRVIQRVDPIKQGGYTYIALYPACDKNTLIPPYPGVVPQGIRDPSNSVSCFSDGTLGCWDPRTYPLLYESTRPWLGFHKAPFVMPLTRPQEEFVQDVFGNYRRVSDLRREHPEYLPATEYYHWNAPGEPWKGGTWDRYLISRLFCARRNAELFALSALQEYEKGVGYLLDLSNFERPYYDELEWEDTLVWVSWAEGRDALARTSRYTAEMDALGNWLEHMCKRLTGRPCEMRARTDLYMGVWAMTISATAEWDELRHAGVPIYVGHEVHPGSALIAQARPGDLDADERYRQNSYNFTHQMPNWPHQPPRNYNFVIQNVKHGIQPHNPPCQLTTPPHVRSVTEDTSKATSWNKPWTSYTYLDSSLPRFLNSKLLRVGLNRALANFHRESLLLAPFLPPGRRALTTEELLHPFFFICPPVRERGMRCYLERYDEGIASWWFEPVKGQSHRDAKSSSYCFNYPAESIIIYSNHEFPGQHPLFCRVSKIPPMTILPSTRLRSYFWTFSDVGGNPTYTWEYRGQEDNEPTEGEQMESEQSSVVTGGREDTESANEGDTVSDDVTVDMGWESDGQPLSWSERLQRLLEQRRQLELEVNRRLFFPIRENLRSDAVLPWSVPGTVGGLVWPVRIANLYGETRYESVVDMLVNACHIRAVDILLLCPYLEVDTTLTLDIGLRYFEDAMWVWSMLHGVMVDERCLEVYPLLSMKGRTIIHDVSEWREREAGARLARWDTLSHCEDTAPPSEFFSEHLDKFALYAGQCESEEEISSGSEHREAIVCGLPSLVAAQTNTIQQQRETTAFDGCANSPQTRPNLYAAVKGSLQWKQNPNIIPQRASVASTPTCGSKEPQINSTSNHASKPYARPQHGSETAEKKRRSRHGRPRKGRLHQDGEEASRMTAAQRRSVSNTFKEKAKRIIDSCKFAMPEYIPASTEGCTGAEAIVKVMSQWWDWADECRHVLDSERHSLMMQGRAQEYDWSMVEQVFGHLAKLQSIYGEERDLCMDVLRDRPPWISRIEPTDVDVL